MSINKETTQSHKEFKITQTTIKFINNIRFENVVNYLEQYLPTIVVEQGPQRLCQIKFCNGRQNISKLPWLFLNDIEQFWLQFDNIPHEDNDTESNSFKIIITFFNLG